jgi:MraZ protein
VFTGRHERQLDPKGRLALPAEFRRQFEHQCFLTFGESSCIEVFTPEAFKDMADVLMEKVRRGEASRDAIRGMAHNTFTVNVDGQGRIVLTPELRAYAGIELNSRVVVAGAIDRMEIWNAETYGSVNERNVAGLRGS